MNVKFSLRVEAKNMYVYSTFLSFLCWAFLLLSPNITDLVCACNYYDYYENPGPFNGNN
jgi:hypothetical protein